MVDLVAGKVDRRGIAWLGLDGLRAISIVLVLLVHAGLRHAQGGIVGVDVFFVISGFLITSLLIGERDSHGGYVSFKAFYARRALRLFPALGAAIVLAAVLVAAGLAARQGHHTVTGLPFVILYVGDIARAVGSSQELGTLGTTWSLAIEEQFYLIWPLMLVLILNRVRRRELVASGLAGLAILEWFWRIALLHHGATIMRITVSPDTRSDGLLFGCAAAFWLSSRASRPLNQAIQRLASIHRSAGVERVLRG